MVDRVILDTQGLRVSIPGVDVKTAAASGLIFDSKWSNLKLWMRSRITASGGGVLNRVPFGKTFANPPLVFFYVVSGDTYLPTGLVFTNNFVVTGQVGSSLIYVAYITTDSSGLNIRVGNPGSGPNKVISYSVWDWAT